MKPEIENMDWRDGTRSLRAYRRTANTFDWNWHYHPEIELTLITRGSGTRLVGDSSEAYTTGDLVLLGSNLPHTWFSGEPGHSPSSNQAIVVQFLASAFPESLVTLPEFAPIRLLFQRAQRGLHYSREMAREFAPRIRKLPEFQGLAGWMELCGLLGDLSERPSTVLARDSYRHQRSFRLESRLGRILDHIEKNCTRPLSLEEMAEFSGLTTSSFARFFRKMTGRTFVEHRNACRIDKARRMLDESDHRILDIAYASGFQSLPNFNRDFRRRIGLTPRDYRKLRNPQHPAGGQAIH